MEINVWSDYLSRKRLCYEKYDHTFIDKVLNHEITLIENTLNTLLFKRIILMEKLEFKFRAKDNEKYQYYREIYEIQEEQDNEEL